MKRRWLLLGLFALFVILAATGKRESYWDATKQQREEIISNAVGRAVSGPSQAWRDLK
jgi:hypothetical protein